MTYTEEMQAAEQYVATLEKHRSDGLRITEEFMCVSVLAITHAILALAAATYEGTTNH